MEHKIVDVFMKEIDDIRFESIDELYQRRREIREKYLKLSVDFKQIYKWYFFFQLCVVKKLALKRSLWYFINEEQDSININTEIDLAQEYRNFCKSREKIVEEEQQYNQDLTENEDI